MSDLYRRSANDEELMKFDPYAHAMTVITEPHRMNHDGFMFHASGKVDGMVNNNVDDFLIVTAASNYPHLQRMMFDFGSGDVTVETYEGSTASADGTPIAAFNTNRNSSNTPDLILNSAPTITDVGARLHIAWAPPTASGRGRSAQGISDVVQGEEWILAPSTKYLVRVTNNSGETISYRHELLWYEIDYKHSETKVYG